MCTCCLADDCVWGSSGKPRIPVGSRVKGPIKMTTTVLPGSPWRLTIGLHSICSYLLVILTTRHLDDNYLTTFRYLNRSHHAFLWPCGNDWSDWNFWEQDMSASSFPELSDPKTEFAAFRSFCCLRRVIDLSRSREINHISQWVEQLRPLRHTTDHFRYPRVPIYKLIWNEGGNVSKRSLGMGILGGPQNVGWPCTTQMHFWFALVGKDVF